MDETLTDSTYLILLALLKPQHGYAIMKEITVLTDGNFEIGPASMYTILKKLVKSEWIQLEETLDRKKIYHITPQGIDVLKKEVQRRKVFYQAGEKMLAKFTEGSGAENI
ncbi:PadR family transcriptional regulator [Enterococcus saccharolyticus]|uniref:PadR family transcriptional regulator n=1 Tax=Candidatus Enterococcus willemsii TaxID=1857215 RepID=A0ABQ6Z1T3_9ENTE|nr:MULTISPECIES: PadR family transcriptional regulator [Enterococcus]KAF1305125.1 PadR family transcriptional regulator [Enterococcus sp. CU12B]MCD5002500.1 PadR family transcriptional regulator [Enterococcus saccharolyticus]